MNRLHFASPKLDIPSGKIKQETGFERGDDRLRKYYWSGHDLMEDTTPKIPIWIARKPKT